MSAFTINIPIRTLDANDVKEAFASAYGYTEYVTVGGVSVTNPISKEEFVKQKCINFMLEITRSYLIKLEEVQAKDAVQSAVDSRSQEVIGWFDNRRLNSVGGMDAFTNFPTVDDLNLTTNKNQPVNFTLTGTDQDNLPLNFYITTYPANGSIIGQSPNFIYLPNNRYFGADSFKFKANNGSKNSLEGLVSVVINRTLTAVDNYYTLRKNQSIQITLNAHDSIGSVSYNIIDSTTHGSMTGTNIVSYTPDTNYTGIDTFTFTAQDDFLTSNLGTITIDISTIVVDVQTFNCVQNETYSFQPQAFNAIGIPEFTIANQPSNGSLIINNGEFIYTPNLNFVGTDSFGLVATDMYDSSEVGIYYINVI